ncbi:hypothetical protein [Lactococcus sp.]|uniref:hypothetical protein n=1 Tax=Lactococcus sp. TaxID=44273 RepID=UPI0035AD9A71
MLIFLWIFMTAVFGIVYLFQLIHLNLIGLELIALLILYISFRQSKQNAYGPIWGMDIVMAFVMSILYYSHRTFTYISPNDTEKLILVIMSFVLSQIFGMFWGRQFYKHQHQQENKK